MISASANPLKTLGYIHQWEQTIWFEPFLMPLIEKVNPTAVWQWVLPGMGP